MESQDQNQSPDHSPKSVKPEPRRIVAEISELVGGLAHELRNPLSTMMINLKLLAEDLQDQNAHPEDARRRALLKVDTLSHEAERLQRLFDEFLSLTGPCRLQRDPTDINELVRRVAEFVQPAVVAESVEIRLSLDDSLPRCPADAALLRQALLNLVINARQAMPDGGVLGLATLDHGDWIAITVSDAGVGVSPSDRDRIMHPFYSTKSGGTGLGLSISQRIIHDHGGELDFESVQDGGTTFTIRIPKVAPD